MLNKSNSEKSSAKFFLKSQNSSSNLLTNSQKKSTSKIKKCKLNSILNRTLSDSVLNRKFSSFTNPWYHHKKQSCLSRKNSTNRRSLIYNPNSFLFNQNLLYSNTSSNKKSSYTSASTGPQSPNVISVQSPIANIFSNQNSILNLNQYNFRNKLKQYRSSCCVINNNVLQQEPFDNYSLSSSICSSLSPSPITIFNRHNQLVLSTPPSNINSNFPSSSKFSQPVSSPLATTPASALNQRNLPSQSFLPSNSTKKDSRRWSLASIHSSGFKSVMNTPKGTSSLPPCFQHQSAVVPLHSSSSNNLIERINKDDNKNELDHKTYKIQEDKIISDTNKSYSILKNSGNEENNTQYSQRLSFGNRRRRLSSSNESSQLDDSSEVGFSSPLSFHRQRARSLSCSPCKGLNDSDMATTEKFKEKFPKACKQLEQNLQIFIDVNKIDLNTTNSLNTNETQVDLVKNAKYYVQQPNILDPAARFIQNQVIEIAKLCLEKSKSNQLTCSYLDEMTNSLEKLLLEARDKCCQVELSVEYLQKFIKKFLFIISHVSRLLECIEFDPLEFSHFLDCAEQQAKQQEIKTDIPKYIISKLGIDRDPIKELINEDEIMQSLNRTNSLTSTTSTSGFSGDDFLPSDFSLTTTASLKSEPQPIATPNIDDFEEIKLISNGAYGAVHLVRHKILGNRFAMKKIKKQNIILRNQIQQVFTERDIMTFTDNPFVVALICTFETKKHLCMVMEYVEGGDVATLIKNMGPLPLDMARTYFAETTLAVEYLHNYGIIHRDLKPDNLLITSLGHIKLTDFGLSKIGLMNLTTNFYEDDNFMKDLYCKEFNDKQICGTPQYLAPEVILRQSYGKTVDWWSMGIILYEFFTSFAPFNGNTPEDLFSKVINGEICWPDDDDEIIQIPDDAKNLILGLLTHEPIKRLGANGAIEIKQHPFFNFLDWNNLLRIKAEFIPQLDGPDDTSYFDTRSERYNHDTDSYNSLNPHSSFLSLPIEQAMYKVDSANSFNRQISNDDKVLTDLLNKNLMLNDNNDNCDRLNSDDDTDNELFASFSSCSSKFRLGSLSNNNSPVLFMNESANSIRLNMDSGSNISINSLNNQNSLIHSSSKNHLAEEKIKMPKLHSMPIDTQVLDFDSKKYESKFESIHNIKKPLNKDSFSSFASNTSTVMSDKDIKTEKFLNSKSEQTSFETIKSCSSTPVVTPTTPITTNNKIKHFLQNNQQKSSNLSQLISKSSKENKESKDFDKSNQPTNEKNFQSNIANNKNNQCKLNRWFSSIVSNSSKTTTSTNLNKKESINSQNSKPNNSFKSNIKSKDEFKKPLLNDSISNRLANTNKQQKTCLSQNNKSSVIQSNIQNFPPYQSQTFRNQTHYNDFVPLSEMIQMGLRNPKIAIKRNALGFGFALRAIKVFYGDSDFYTIQHLVVQIDQQGPAYSTGLKINDIITHVNDQVVCGKMHSEIVKLMMSSLNNTLFLNTVQLNQTNIKTGGRKRSPSRNKQAGPFNQINYQYQQINLNHPFNRHINCNVKHSNVFYPQNHSNQNYNPNENRGNFHPSFSGLSLLSNPSTSNSSTSSLISNSSRRSLGACVGDYAYTHYNTNYGPSIQNSHFFPNPNQQFLHQIHMNNSQAFVAPIQPVQQERKKKPCLLRKLSERYANAHKSELQRQFQLQKQNQVHHSSSSSSSSSSLNNSFNVKSLGNQSPKFMPTQVNTTSQTTSSLLINKETENSIKNLKKMK